MEQDAILARRDKIHETVLGLDQAVKLLRAQMVSSQRDFPEFEIAIEKILIAKDYLETEMLKLFNC